MDAPETTEVPNWLLARMQRELKEAIEERDRLRVELVNISTLVGNPADYSGFNTDLWLGDFDSMDDVCDYGYQKAMYHVGCVMGMIKP